MKKLLFTLFFSAAVVSAQAAIFINNNTDCDVLFFLYAHDASNPGLTSNTITISAHSSVAYNNVSSLNITPGWSSGVMATTTGGVTSWGWDCAKFEFPLSGASGGFGVNCGDGTHVVFANACLGNTVDATWTVAGSNTFVDFN